jgi:hypothetical protein
MAAIAIAVCLVAVASAAGADRPSWVADAITTIHRYTPYSDGRIAIGVHVARSASGYCWTAAGADARGDAYRCFNGNFIHDPCFAESHRATYVLCPLYFPGSNVLRINLTKKLPANPGARNPMRYAPWAVRTVSGKWCSLFTGAGDRIAGLWVRYGCSGGGLLLGTPHRRSSSPWTIFYVSGYKSTQYRPVDLVSAWW